MSTTKHRRQRARKYRQQGGRCWWCKQPMVLEPPVAKRKKMNPRMCTLDHLRDRFDPNRGKQTGERCIVASCWECNSARGAKSQAAQPIEELRRRSRSGYFGLRGWAIPLGKIDSSVRSDAHRSELAPCRQTVAGGIPLLAFVGE